MPVRCADKLIFGRREKQRPKQVKTNIAFDTLELRVKPI